MKKLLSVLLMVFMLTGLTLTGCKKNSDVKTTTGKISLTVGKTAVKATGSAAKTAGKTTSVAKTGGDNNPIDPDEPSGDDGESGDGTEEPQEEELLDMGGKTITIGWPAVNIEFDNNKTFNQNQVDCYNYISQKYNVKFTTKSFAGAEWESTFVAGILSGIPVVDFFQQSILPIIPRLVINNMIWPLDDIIDYNNELYNTPAQDYCMWDGKHYGWMNGYNVPDTNSYIAYNRNLFDNRGLPYPKYYLEKGVWTWETMLDLAIQLTLDTNGDGVNDQWGISDNPVYTGPGVAFTFSNGKQVVDAVNGNFIGNLTSQNMLQAMQLLNDLVNVYKVMPFIPMGATTVSPFMNGQAAMGFWNTSARVAMKSPPNCRLVIYPRGPMAGDNYMAVGGTIWMCSIPVTTDKEYARKLMRIWLDYNTLEDVPGTDMYVSPEEADQLEAEKRLTQGQIFDPEDYYDAIKYVRPKLGFAIHSLLGSLSFELIKPNGMFDEVIKTTTPPATVMESKAPWLKGIIDGILQR
jgi:hypothetical protein